jgi:hypothetical protein
MSFSPHHRESMSSERMRNEMSINNRNQETPPLSSSDSMDSSLYSSESSFRDCDNGFSGQNGAIDPSVYCQSQYRYKDQSDERQNESNYQPSSNQHQYFQEDYSSRTVRQGSGGTYYVDNCGRDLAAPAIQESLRKYLPQYSNSQSNGHYSPKSERTRGQNQHILNQNQPPSHPYSQAPMIPHSQYPRSFGEHQNSSKKMSKTSGGNRLSSRGTPPVNSYTCTSDLQFATNFPLIYVVNFKRTKDQFIHSVSYPHSFRKGDFVKVEADRGHDVGIISEIVLLPSHVRGNISVAELEIALNVPIPHRYALQHASDKEIQVLLNKVRDESRALQVCRQLAQQRQMKLNLLDAEFQFDKNKLTFIFTSDRHIDFRELVRDLFAIFKTRIWMHKINQVQAAAFIDGFGQGEPFQGAMQNFPNENTELHGASSSVQRKHDLPPTPSQTQRNLYDVEHQQQLQYPGSNESLVNAFERHF